MAQPVTQTHIQELVQKIMLILQNFWDNPNPGPQDKARLDLVLEMLGLQNPVQTQNLITKLQSAAKKGRARTLELVADAADAEYDLVAFIAGDGTTVPSWEDIAAEVVVHAIAGSKPAASKLRPKPASTPPSANTAQSPADFLSTNSATTTSTPSAQSASTPDPAPGSGATNTAGRGVRRNR